MRVPHVRSVEVLIKGTVRDRGSTVARFTIPEDAAAIARITHRGGSTHTG
ncbi:MAG TPA: hypothetical protein VFP66_15800 [Candidatus Limnocylindrales bacterium]|nr:hypothetical protein [Candidatus Limnocylindrales bacterium]